MTQCRLFNYNFVCLRFYVFAILNTKSKNAINAKNSDPATINYFGTRQRHWCYKPFINLWQWLYTWMCLQWNFHINNVSKVHNSIEKTGTLLIFERIQEITDICPWNYFHRDLVKIVQMRALTMHPSIQFMFSRSMILYKIIDVY